MGVCLRVCGHDFPLGKCVGITLILFTLIGVPILIATSLVKIDDGDRAVLYSSITQEIFNIVGPGLHTSVPGVASEAFSRRVVVQSVSQKCTTREGIQVDLEVEAQYLYSDDLIEMFRTVGTASDANSLVDSITRDAILTACGNITATSMYLDRGATELSINAMIRAALNNDGLLIGENAPVRTIKLPDALMDQLTQKDAALEQVEVAEREREPTLIDANTAKEAAQFARTAAVQDAVAEAERIIYKAEQDAETVMQELQILGERLMQSANDLGITPLELLTDVLETKQRGEEQSRSLQLCLADCKRPSAEGGFSCGTCYLVNGGLSDNIMLNMNP